MPNPILPTVEEIAREYAGIIERRINTVLRDHGIPAAEFKKLDDLIVLAIQEYADPAAKHIESMENVAASQHMDLEARDEEITRLREALESLEDDLWVQAQVNGAHYCSCCEYRYPAHSDNCSQAKFFKAALSPKPNTQEGE